MALYLPPSVSISRFSGKYRSKLSYGALDDTDTNDAQNVLYGPQGSIDKRNGCQRLYNTALTSSGGATGRPVTGHYYFTKTGASSTLHIVAAGDSLYNYSSATATAIRTGLTDNSDTFWSFVQIQDPRSASDDVIIGTNGADAIQLWNGSGTAVALSSLTSASSVPICKYILEHKRKIYGLNVIDSTDADAGAKVVISEIGSDGNPNPHRFTQSFYVGGSDRGGEIAGAAILHDQIVIYKERSIWKFNPTPGAQDLIEVQRNVGLWAPRSLVDTGDFHIFLSDQGVMAFDGVNVTNLSEEIEDNIFDNSNSTHIRKAKAVYNKSNKQYTLWYPTSGSARNDRALMYDLRPGMLKWQPPVTGKRISFISTFRRTDRRDRVIFGDYLGYLYEDDIGSADGLSTGVNSTATSGTFSTLVDSAANFSVTGDGLAGLLVRIHSGLGAGQERVIASNDSQTLTLDSNWVVVPDSTSKYTVGGIDAYWQSKDYSFGAEDITKIFRHLRVRTQEEGLINLTCHYIIDFKQLNRATSFDLQLLLNGMVWDTDRWDEASWGGGGDIRKKISLRNTPSQSVMGSHFAVRYSNNKANQPFKIKGYDIELKAIGRR